VSVGRRSVLSHDASTIAAHAAAAGLGFT
jgi:hypothetical protein